jgi:hypothetical protein
MILLRINHQNLVPGRCEAVMELNVRDGVRHFGPRFAGSIERQENEFSHRGRAFQVHQNNGVALKRSPKKHRAKSDGSGFLENRCLVGGGESRLSGVAPISLVPFTSEQENGEQGHNCETHKISPYLRLGRRGIVANKYSDNQENSCLTKRGVKCA